MHFLRKLPLVLLMALSVLPAVRPAWAESASVPLPAASSGSSAPNPIISPADDLLVELSAIEGEVQVRAKNSRDFVDARSRTVLHAGDFIRSLDGSCRLKIDGKADLDLLSDTELLISEALKTPGAITAKLQLDSGRIRAKLNKLKVGSTFEITTPTAIAAVRGTTLFLNAGEFNGQKGSELYVDETSHGVQFTNLQSHHSFLVKAYSLSRSLADGSLDEPKFLDRQAREAFIRSWNETGGGPSQQFGIEEAPLPGLPPSPDTGLPETLDRPLVDDAAIDRLVEQSIPTLNELPLLPSPLPGLVGTPPSDEEKPGGGSGGQTPPDTQPPGDPTPPDTGIDEQERAMIRQEIAFLRGDQDFDRADANLAQISDAQTGKVFTDVHGNRVRVDQYIFQEQAQGLAVINLLSLTARTGSYQNGVSAMRFMTLLNRPLEASDGRLRDLPWNDWMRVVTSTQLTGLGESFPYEQFIVHEHSGSDPESGPGLFPVVFLAEFFRSPQTSGPAFTVAEIYSSPLFVNADQGNFWVQGLGAREITATNGSLQPISSIETPFAKQGFIGSSEASLEAVSGPQTAGFAQDTVVSALDTSEGLASLFGSGVHPSFFAHTIGGTDVILGLFIPIDDQGRVIDAPGFEVHGLRDLVFSHANVAGGRYNLETILAAGSLNNGAFTENFRIDLIITPEIFSGFGLKNPDGTPNDGTIFSSDSGGPSNF